jgi:hypothetical protein
LDPDKGDEEKKRGSSTGTEHQSWRESGGHSIVSMTIMRVEADLALLSLSLSLS